MKFLKKCLLFLLLSSVLCGAVGCKKSQTDQYKRDDDVLINRVSYDGVHINNITETNREFIKNGNTDYVLIVPAVLSAELTTAKNDFLYLFKQATNIDLIVLKDTGVKHSKNAKYLSIGNTETFQSTGLTVSASELGYDGYQIFTVDDSIYMVGAYDVGSAYSIYSFFEHAFHYEAYYSDCIVIDKDVKNLNFKIFDVKEIPDVALRTSGMFAEMGYYREETPDSKYFSARMKSLHHKHYWVMPFCKKYDKSTATNSDHSSFVALPKETYSEKHPKWYSNNGNQLCYTARGDEKELDLMAQELAKKIIFSYQLYDKESYPYMNVIHFGMEDNYNSCSCDECVRLSDYYGTEAGAVCIFVNKAAKIFKEWENGKSVYELFDKEVIGSDASWMDVDPKPYKRDDFRILFFAYNNLVKAPVTYDAATKTYTPIDDKVILLDNVGVYHADIEMDWANSLYNPYNEVNEEARINLGAWATLTNKIWNWNYCIYYNSNTVFYDGFNTINANDIAYRAACGVDAVYTEGDGSQYARDTGFNALKMYLHYKLYWNSALNTQELVDNYFDAMFADASDIMYEMFMDIRTYCAYINQINGLNNKNSVYNAIVYEKYWDKQTLRNWMNMCDEAVSLIGKYKDSNPEYYEKLRGRIKQEYVFPCLLFLRLYGNKIPVAEKNELLNNLKSDAEKYDLLKLRDSKYHDRYLVDILNGL